MYTCFISQQSPASGFEEAVFRGCPLSDARLFQGKKGFSLPIKHTPLSFRGPVTLAQDTCFSGAGHTHKETTHQPQSTYEHPINPHRIWGLPYLSFAFPVIHFLIYRNLLQNLVTKFGLIWQKNVHPMSPSSCV